MSADDAIRTVLRQYDEDFNDKGTVWRVQGTAVISHKALERIAAKAGIKYASPTIIRAERDEAVLLVSGTLGDRMEWSIGEALVNVNYRVSGKQAGYVWAMAEKRAKDRVILKLVSLHGLAFSEEEADEFKGGDRQQASTPATPSPQGGNGTPFDDDTAAVDYAASVFRKIATSHDPIALKTWWGSPKEKQARRDFGLTIEDVKEMKDALMARLMALGDERQAA
ncbi:hypothetical protein ASG40_11505 [Methylobacterium sp. Leaf399]|uniref:hypothetical protein n=1 Tax=Methylobacterium sp. Leaf399 TaxID=1736364 RepID=UPI0006FDB646|nr:hypothetical protein [Methylobacterium sp. Leaf399]KQT08500.1 hypothetical protein ASG40_11505 [Methylobacterium sp. Leaf399]